MKSFTDYKTIISNEFNLRKERRRKYSLRAFARDLKLSPSRLSEVMNGSHHLSRESALRISKALQYDDRMERYFLALVDQHDKKYNKRREDAKQYLSKAMNEDGFKFIEADYFRIISDWYHLAILEATKLSRLTFNSKRLANFFGLEQGIVADGLLRLIQTGLLKKDGYSFIATNAAVTTSSAVPSEYIQKAHRQLLEKALRAISEQAVEDRDFGALYLAINKGDLPRIKQKIMNFRRELDQEFDQAKNKDSLYCFTTQFFSLEKGNTLG